MSKGIKHDKGKPRMDLLMGMPDALEAVGRVLTYGSQKYAPGNWQDVPDLQRRYLAAAMRHEIALARGEERDPETGEHHLAHVACCVLFRLQDALAATVEAQPAGESSRPRGGAAWIKHNRSRAPDGLAMAQMVEWTTGSMLDDEEWTTGSMPDDAAPCDRVDAVPWEVVAFYRPLTASDGTPYCSAEGLEPWAEYVVTDADGECKQMDRAPQQMEREWAPSANGSIAPPTHRYRGDWRDSLMRVWRGEL